MRHLLVREVCVWLAIQLAALTAIFLLFFGSEQRLEAPMKRADAFAAEDSLVRISLEP